jgi:hypothetical protein
MTRTPPPVVLAIFDDVDVVAPVVRRGAEIAEQQAARLLVIRHRPVRTEAVCPPMLASFGIPMPAMVAAPEPAEASGFGDAVEALLRYRQPWHFAEVTGAPGWIVRDLAERTVLRGVVIPTPERRDGRRRHYRAQDVHAATRRLGEGLLTLAGPPGTSPLSA